MAARSRCCARAWAMGRRSARESWRGPPNLLRGSSWAAELRVASVDDAATGHVQLGEMRMPAPDVERHGAGRAGGAAGELGGVVLEALGQRDPGSMRGARDGIADRL